MRSGSLEIREGLREKTPRKDWFILMLQSDNILRIICRISQNELNNFRISVA